MVRATQQIQGSPEEGIWQPRWEVGVFKLHLGLGGGRSMRGSGESLEVPKPWAKYILRVSQFVAKTAMAGGSDEEGRVSLGHSVCGEGLQDAHSLERLKTTEHQSLTGKLRHRTMQCPV